MEVCTEKWNVVFLPNINLPMSMFIGSWHSHCHFEHASPPILVNRIILISYFCCVSRPVVRHAVSLLVSAAFTDGTVRSSLLQQSNFKPWLQQLVLLAKEVKFRFRLVLSEVNIDSKKETVYDLYSFFGISCLFPFLECPRTNCPIWTGLELPSPSLPFYPSCDSLKLI